MDKIKVKAVFFDLWNTIAFTGSKDIFREMQVRFGLNEITHAQFLQECENAIMLEEFHDLEHLYTKLLNHFSVPSGEILLGDLDFLWSNALKKAKLFPEAEKVLKKTRKSFKTALISNCENFGVKALLNSNGFDLKKYFNEVVFSYETGLLKPNPKIFSLALKKLKLKPEEAVMVGDSVRTDVNGARKAGMKAILIDRKRKNNGKKLNADRVIHSLNELEEVIEYRE
jgi:putative hydrolase of the HAD superfamily